MQKMSRIYNNTSQSFIDGDNRYIYVNNTSARFFKIVSFILIILKIIIEHVMLTRLKFKIFCL